MMFSPRSVSGVTGLQALALALPTGVTLWSAPVASTLVLAVGALAALLWEMVFAGLRKRAFSAHGITTALIFSLVCPPEIALWQVALSVSFGAVFGELIFGGRGFGFVSPAALALSFLVISYPDAALPAPTPDVALAVLPGLALLLWAGLVSQPVIAGVAFAVFALLAASGESIALWPVATALSVGTVFLIADPTAAAVTSIGRWVYGALAGALVVVFSPPGEITPEAVVAAALLASVFAPLIDHGAELVHARLREGRGHG